MVASALNRKGIATLLFDLLTPAEEADRRNVFNIPLLANRLFDAVRWLDAQAAISKLPLGLFGASTGAAAALVSAAKLPDRIGAVVSRGGRPDLAGDAIETVRAPTLLLVGATTSASSSSKSRPCSDCAAQECWRLFQARAIFLLSPKESVLHAASCLKTILLQANRHG
jgi:dienelactone hydrolase